MRQPWVPADLLRLVRLLGKHPAEAGYDESLNAVMSAFEARYCGMAELVFQQSQADVPPELRQPWRAWAAEPPEGSGLRECLLGLVGGQLRRLRERVEAFESEPSSLAAAAVLADRRVMALQRLQLSRSRELRLALDVLRKARAVESRRVGTDHPTAKADAGGRCPPDETSQRGKEIDDPPAMMPQPSPARAARSGSESFATAHPNAGRAARRCHLPTPSPPAPGPRPTATATCRRDPGQPSLGLPTQVCSLTIRSVGVRRRAMTVAGRSRLLPDHEAASSFRGRVSARRSPLTSGSKRGAGPSP
jgi:hypothetical protein